MTESWGCGGRQVPHEKRGQGRQPLLLALLLNLLSLHCFFLPPQCLFDFYLSLSHTFPVFPTANMTETLPPMTMTAETTALLDVQRSLLGRCWLERPYDDGELRAMTQNGMSEILARVLAARGVRAENSESHLQPRLRDLMPDPFSLAGMEAAVECLLEALDAGKNIAIFADYDADGATSCALLQRYLRTLGAEARIHIPDRIEDGYGPNAATFKHLRDKGAELVILMDCGAVAHEPLQAARDMGLETLVFDHHLCSEGDMPPTRAMINPKRRDDQSGLDFLATAGVIFFFLVACNSALRQRGRFAAGDEPQLMPMLDLVALATICDVVPLTPLNRAFVRNGLWMLQNGGGNPGLLALAREAGVQLERIAARDLGFALGPRINAAGRVGKSELAARLLITDDAEEAVALALQTVRWNRERQKIEAQALTQAMRQIEKQEQLDAVLFAWDREWHPGVIGIVASRLKDRYRRASVVIGRAGGPDGAGRLRGSCRSIPGFDMGAMILAAVEQGILLHGGGHPMAAGFTIAEENLPAFRDFAQQHALRAGAGQAEAYYLDGVLGLRAVGLAEHELLQRAGPYGKENEEPRFAFASVRAVRGGLFGQGQNHVSCILSADDGASLRALAFHAATSPVGEALLNRSGRALHVAGRLEENSFRGERSLRLLVEDVAECR